MPRLMSRHNPAFTDRITTKAAPELDIRAKLQ